MLQGIPQRITDFHYRSVVAIMAFAPNRIMGVARGYDCHGANLSILLGAKIVIVREYLDVPISVAS